MNNLIEKHVKLGKIALNLFLLNLCWALTTLLGLIIFGIVPATKVLYRNILEWQEDKSYKKLIKEFLYDFKSEIVQANRQIFPLFILFFCLIIERQTLSVFHFTVFDHGIYILLTFLILLTLLMILNLFVLSNGEPQKNLYLYKKSLILIFGRPLYSVGSFLFLLMIFSIYYFLPGLFMVFGISIFVYIDTIYLSRKLDYHYLQSK